MCVFCFSLSMSGSYSVLLYASILVLLKKGWEGGKLHRAILVAPDNPWLLSRWAFFIQLPLFFISFFLPLTSGGSLLLLLSPLPPFVTNTAALSMSNPLEQPWKVNMEPIDSLLSVCNSWGRESKHSWNNHRWGKTIVTTFHIRQEYMFREKLVFSENTKKKKKTVAFFIHSVKIYAGITEMFK